MKTDISFKIRQLSKLNNLSQKEISDKIGYTPAALSNALMRNDFKISTLEKIAEAFNVPVSYFFVNDTGNSYSESEIEDLKRELDICRKRLLTAEDLLSFYAEIFRHPEYSIKSFMNILRVHKMSIDTKIGILMEWQKVAEFKTAYEETEEGKKLKEYLRSYI